MTHSQVAKRINELVPETMELSFGCRVEVMFNDGEVEHGIIVGTEDNQKIQWDDGRVGVFLEDTVSKILGHPITLEHVLMAMPDKIYINSDGSFGHFHKHDHFSPRVFWALGKPLSDQSQETIDFLGEVLGV